MSSDNEFVEEVLNNLRILSLRDKKLILSGLLLDIEQEESKEVDF